RKTPPIHPVALQPPLSSE
ncbi:hypothetical protein TNCV_3823351, partial [Trichonephila clavipes]